MTLNLDGAKELAAGRDLISMEHPWARGLVEKIGHDAALACVNHMRDEGIPFEVPAAFKKMVVSRAPLMVLTFLNEQGHPIAESEPKELGAQDVARTGNWILSIDGENQMHLKSLEIPKLDYENNEILTVGLTYYAIASPEKKT